MVSPSVNWPSSTPRRQRVSTERWIAPQAAGRHRPDHTPRAGRVDRLSSRAELDHDLPILEALGQAAQLDVDDPLHVLAPERVEEDDSSIRFRNSGRKCSRSTLMTQAPRALVDGAALGHRALGDSAAAECSTS